MCAVLLTGHGGLEKLEYLENYPVPDVVELEFMQKKYIGKLVVIPDRFYQETKVDG